MGGPGLWLVPGRSESVRLEGRAPCYPRDSRTRLSRQAPASLGPRKTRFQGDPVSGGDNRHRGGSGQGAAGSVPRRRPQRACSNGPWPPPGSPDQVGRPAAPPHGLLEGSPRRAAPAAAASVALETAAVSVATVERGPQRAGGRRRAAGSAGPGAAWVPVGPRERPMGTAGGRGALGTTLGLGSASHGGAEGLVHPGGAQRGTSSAVSTPSRDGQLWVALPRLLSPLCCLLPGTH